MLAAGEKELETRNYTGRPEDRTKRLKTATRI